MIDRVTGPTPGQTPRLVTTSDRIPRMITGSPPPAYRHQRRPGQEQDDYRLPGPIADNSNRHQGGDICSSSDTRNTSGSSRSSPTRKHPFTLPPIASFEHGPRSPNALTNRLPDQPVSRMNTLGHGGGGMSGWQDSWHGRDASASTGFRHIPDTSPWSSGDAAQPSPFDRTSESGLPPSGRYPYQSGTPRGLEPLALGSISRPDFPDPYLLPPPLRQVDNRRLSNYSSPSSFETHSLRGNTDPATHRSVDYDHAQWKFGILRPPVNSKVGVLSPSPSNGYDLGRSPHVEQRSEPSVPPPRGSQTFGSSGSNMPSASTSSMSQYRSLTAMNESTARGSNASPLHSMRVLGEAVPTLASTSGNTMSKNTGTMRDRGPEERLSGRQDRDRPRKRAKIKAGNGGSVKDGTGKGSKVVDAREMISAYCDELCDLAEGTIESDSAADAQRLSDLSRQIVLRLSAIASDAGLDDLVVTEQDLESGLEPLSLGDSSNAVQKGKLVQATKPEGEDIIQSFNPPKILAKPTSVMNVQTPQEAARDMEFIRTRRDELNAKAAAAEKELKGKEREEVDDTGLAGRESGLAEQIHPASIVTSPIIPAPAAQPMVISPAPEISMSTASPLELQASIVPIRHPYRISTYEPFMPFPYMMTTPVIDGAVSTAQSQIGAVGLTHLIPMYGNDLLPRQVHRSCHSCGIMQTSEWKLGPDGPDTLCGVCGVHWLQQIQSWPMLPPYFPTKVGGAL